MKTSLGIRSLTGKNIRGGFPFIKPEHSVTGASLEAMGNFSKHVKQSITATFGDSEKENSVSRKFLKAFFCLCCCT